jgi:protein phosphatase 1L
MHYVQEDQGQRPYMEDTNTIITDIVPGIDYYAIFDGHGGKEVSKFLAENMHEYVRDLLRMNETPDNALLLAFKRCAEEIPMHMSVYTGSTALVILCTREHVFLANCGDCRAIINENQTAVQITDDHKPHTEKERIMESGGTVTFHPNDVPRVNGRLAVSRSIGDFHLFPHVIWVPEIWTVAIQQFNHFVVAASDGVWDVMENEEVMTILLNKVSVMGLQPGIAHACDEILQISRLRQSGDNITLLVIKVPHDNPSFSL